MSSWKDNLIFYEIYPTSFKDSNGDGIGDLNGITSKLDYVKSLGFNAIWLNPFYKSPFKDGGYDISDFFDVDPKFGTIEDFRNLANKAHELGLKVICDLVPGHASEQNPMFLESAKPERNEYSDLFIWNNSVWDYERPFILISGRYDRNASYMVNFFSHQPAFNYGFNEDIKYSWQMSYEDKRTYKTRDLIVKIMNFWLDNGADGFRVDMADSLVKNDDEKKATIKVWQYIFGEVKKVHKDFFLVSEWCTPDRALKAGFDSDFILDHEDDFFHYLTKENKFSSNLNVLNGGNDEVFKLFKKDLVSKIDDARNNNGHISVISGNHDTWRLATYLNDDELRLFYLIQMTLPGIPFVYYGDELGMKYQKLNSKDGGYHRTGDRTPMKFDHSKNNGFSSSDNLYLPLSDDNLNAEDAMNDKNSLLNYIKDLISLRKKHENLFNNDFVLEDTELRIISYVRDDIKVIVNLTDHEVNFDGEVLFKSNNNATKGNKLQVKSAVILKI
jgi:glycosidase